MIFNFIIQGEEFDIPANDSIKLETIELCARYADDLNQQWHDYSDDYNYRWMFLPENTNKSMKCRIFMSQNLTGDIQSNYDGGVAYLGEVGCKPGHDDLVTYCKMNGWDVLHLHPSNNAR